MVKQGAKFYAEVNVKTEVVLELTQQTHLEVLCTQEDWICVVLPGLGFGWVNVNQLIDIEEEDVSDASPSTELTFTDMPRTDSAFIGFNTLLVQVGHQLSYLDVSRSQFSTKKAHFVLWKTFDK